MPTLDLTTFETNDPDGVLTVTSSSVVAEIAPTTDFNTNVIKDFGAGYFDNVHLDFTANLASHATPTGGFDFVSLSKVKVNNGFNGFVSEAATDWGFCLTDDAGGTKVRFALVRGVFAQYAFWDSGDNARDTDYFITIIKESGSVPVIAYIYSDSGRTSLLSTVTVDVGGSDAYRWLSAFNHTHQASPAAINTITYKDFSIPLTSTGVMSRGRSCLRTGSRNSI